MPRGRRPPRRSVEDLFAIELYRRAQSMGPAMAQVQGPPPNAKKLTDAEEEQLFSFEEPQFRGVSVLEIASQTGKSIEEATMMRYPKRMDLIKQQRPNLDDQVAYSDKVAGRIERKQKADAEAAGAPMAEIGALEAGPAPASMQPPPELQTQAPAAPIVAPMPQQPAGVQPGPLQPGPAPQRPDMASLLGGTPTPVGVQ